MSRNCFPGYPLGTTGCTIPHIFVLHIIRSMTQGFCFLSLQPEINGKSTRIDRRKRRKSRSSCCCIGLLTGFRATFAKKENHQLYRWIDPDAFQSAFFFIFLPFMFGCVGFLQKFVAMLIRSDSASFNIPNGFLVRPDSLIGWGPTKVTFSSGWKIEANRKYLDWSWGRREMRIGVDCGSLDAAAMAAAVAAAVSASASDGWWILFIWMASLWFSGSVASVRAPVSAAALEQSDWRRVPVRALFFNAASYIRK